MFSRSALLLILAGAAVISPERGFATHSSPPDARQHALDRLEFLGLESGPEAFQQAAGSGYGPLIELYLATGADVNARFDHGRTPLLLATIRSDWELANVLLKAGARADLADDDGLTPAMAAAARGNMPLVLQLLDQTKNGAATADRAGHTVLHYAVASRNRDLVKFLLEKLAPDPHAPCCEGCDLVEHAFMTKDWLIIDPILSRASTPLEWSNPARTSLVESLAKADRERVKRLLSLHDGPPSPAEGAQSLLAYALARNDLAQARLLIDCGVDPNAEFENNPDPDLNQVAKTSLVRNYVGREPGMTPLMLAAALGQPEAVRLLLEKGANKRASTQGRYRLIALYFAAWAASPECIQLLIGDCPSRDRLRVEISLSEQRAELIQDGVSVFRTPISSGRPGFATPAGEFVVTDKHRDHRSSIYQDAEMPYFMRLSCRDFGMHQGVVPGRPASHGCIRLPAGAARKLFKEVPIGTWVSISK